MREEQSISFGIRQKEGSIWNIILILGKYLAKEANHGPPNCPNDELSSSFWPGSSRESPSLVLWQIRQRSQSANCTRKEADTGWLGSYPKDKTQQRTSLITQKKSFRIALHSLHRVQKVTVQHLGPIWHILRLTFSDLKPTRNCSFLLPWLLWTGNDQKGLGKSEAT